MIWCHFCVSGPMTGRLGLIGWLLGMAALVVKADPRQEIAVRVPAALEILDSWQAGGVAAERKLHLVYWSPSDREPAPRASERLTRILEDIRDFYAREMKRLGFGPRTIGLDYAADGMLRIHFVTGRKPYGAYDVGSGAEIRNECLPTLRAAGIDPDRETLVIFCNMSNWDPATSVISQNSPYYAGGTHRSGTAWQVDSPILDLDLLAKKEPRVRDGQYGDISVGRYNSIFIGGIAHELGHALGLPHNRERADEREAFGTALMGSGNRAYGEERRGEGRGAFLTLAHGLRLASHPMFSGSVKGFDLRPEVAVQNLEVVKTGTGFKVSGRVMADPPAYAVVGYMDPAGGGDYDAATCTAVPDGEGRFVLEATGLVPGKGQQFRVVVAQASGAMSTFVGSNSPWTVPYDVAADGGVDLGLFEARTRLGGLVGAIDSGDRAAVAREMEALRSGGAGERVLQVAEALAGTLDRGAAVAPAAVEGAKADLSACAPVEARVGWGRPVYDRLPGTPAVVSVGGGIFVRSIYAHAPARHVWDLGGKWKRLSGAAGLADGHGGSVDFTILGDGRKLWTSGRVQAGAKVDFTVDVSGVGRLEMVAGDAGDGPGSDWALWLDPQLTR